MKQIALLFALVVGVLFLAYWSSKPGNLESFFAKTGMAVPTSETKKVITVGSSQFKVDIAQNDQARQVGLSSRDTLPEEEGMLFVLEKNDTKPNFWMKGMKFPIDIIWIKDNVVSEITPNIPVLANNPSDPPKYAPWNNVDYVLEIGAGIAKKRGIKVGDTVVLPPLK